MQEKKLREQLKAAWITLRDILYDAADDEDIEEIMGEMKAVLDATRDGTEMEKLVAWLKELKAWEEKHRLARWLDHVYVLDAVIEYITTQFGEGEGDATDREGDDRNHQTGTS